MRMAFNSHNGLGEREGEGRDAKPPGSVSRLSHTYFKANSRSII